MNEEKQTTEPKAGIAPAEEAAPAAPAAAEASGAEPAQGGQTPSKSGRRRRRRRRKAARKNAAPAAPRQAEEAPEAQPAEPQPAPQAPTAAVPQAIRPVAPPETPPAWPVDAEEEQEPDEAEQARRAEISRTAQMSIQQILEAAAESAPPPEETPEPEPAREEPDDADEPEETSLAARAGAWGMNLLTGVLKWLLLVAVIIAVIAGVGLAWLYSQATEDAIPEIEVSFDGQTLETASYDWQVPVVGNQIKRTYSETLLDEPAALAEPVDSVAPSLNVSPSSFETQLTITYADGEQVFSGSLLSYRNFSFENGEYTAELTVGRSEGASQTAMVTGQQTYLFRFTVAIRPTVRVSSRNVDQGSVVAVRVSGTQSDAAPTLQSTLGSAEFVRSGGAWVAYLAVPLDTAPGAASITVQAGGYTEELNLTVHQGDYGYSDVSSERRRVSPYLGPDQVPAEVEAVLDVADPEIYWAGSGFVQPSLRSMEVLLAYGAPEYVGRTSSERLANIDNGTARVAENTVVSTRWGDELISPANGRVLLAENLGGAAGNTIVIEHGAGVKSIFYGLGSVGVEAGDTVTQGQTIGTTVNATILEVRVGGVAVDPLTVLRNESDALEIY